jgi:hypothetical protein
MITNHFLPIGFAGISPSLHHLRKVEGVGGVVKFSAAHSFSGWYFAVIDFGALGCR